MDIYQNPHNNCKCDLFDDNLLLFAQNVSLNYGSFSSIFARQFDNVIFSICLEFDTKTKIPDSWTSIGFRKENPVDSISNLFPKENQYRKQYDSDEGILAYTEILHNRYIVIVANMKGVMISLLPRESKDCFIKKLLDSIGD